MDRNYLDRKAPKCVDFYRSIIIDFLYERPQTSASVSLKVVKMSPYLVLSLLTLIGYMDVSATLQRINELNEIISSAQREIVSMNWRWRSPKMLYLRPLFAASNSRESTNSRRNASKCSKHDDRNQIHQTSNGRAKKSTV